MTGVEASVSRQREPRSWRTLSATYDRPGGQLYAAGTGAGTRELPGMPNLLRALVFAQAGTHLIDTRRKPTA